MRCVAFAYSGFGHAGLESLARLGVDVAHVFTHRDDPYENTWWPKVGDWCAKRGVPCSFDADLKAPATAELIAGLKPDFAFSLYYRSMIPMRLLDLAPKGAYNLHGSLLPRYRGRAPLNWQLVHGEAQTGLTLHRMVKSADAGDIVAQSRMEIGADEDAFALVNRLLAAAPAFLDAAIGDLVAGRATHRPQDHSLATVFSRRTPADGAIDWRRSARAAHNLVRAVTKPFPGAFTHHGAERIMVWRARVFADHAAAGEPGTALTDNVVACGDGLLEVLDAADAAGKPFTLRRGQRFAPVAAQAAS